MHYIQRKKLESWIRERGGSRLSGPGGEGPHSTVQLPELSVMSVA